MSEPASYDAQHRGDDAAYAQYYAGMDTTMRQKHVHAAVAGQLLVDGGRELVVHFGAEFPHNIGDLPP
jgi:hypothetical protein